MNIALGITWVLDGLEVTIKGMISGVLEEPATLHVTGAEIGLITSFYLTGAVRGSLFFGYLTDLFGLKNFFCYLECLSDRGPSDRLFLEPLELHLLPVQ